LAPDLRKWWVKDIPSIASGWLVGWLVNLVKWAKITISEPIWLKFGMGVLDLKKWWVKDIPTIASGWSVGW
jgi:hypothetical protein